MHGNLPPAGRRTLLQALPLHLEASKSWSPKQQRCCTSLSTDATTRLLTPHCRPKYRYTDLTGCMDSISLEELIMAVRRQSQGFSRGTSTYRGVTHHPSGENTATPASPDFCLSRLHHRALLCSRRRGHQAGPTLASVGRASKLCLITAVVRHKAFTGQ